MPQHDPSSEAPDDAAAADRAPAANPDPEGESPWAFWRGVLITLAVALGVRQFILEARYIRCSGSSIRRARFAACW